MIYLTIFLLVIILLYKNYQLLKTKKQLINDLEEHYQSTHNMTNTLYGVVQLVEQVWGKKKELSEKELKALNAIRESVYGN